MKRIIFLSLLLACTANGAFAQNEVKIHVEDLKSPADTLDEETYEEALKDIVQAGNHLNTREYKLKFDGNKPIGRTLISDSFNYNIIAKSASAAPRVLPTLHSFYDGIFEAYAHHRPFVLSPDMIWLLICQGFAQHINNNAEKLRHFFVQNTGKISLIVEDKTLSSDNPNSPWDRAFDNFSSQIAKYTGQELINVMTSNFSTTTPITKIASQITAMESTKAYFEFVVMYIACGIPDITIEGTPKDWISLRQKAQYLKKYDLAWWIDSLDPILQKFVAASKGEKDISFWQNIFKYRAGAGCGGPAVSNGWIVKFFPYDKEGHRNNLDSISGSGMLPPEIVNVPLKFITVNADGAAKTDELELWAGFVGLSQNKTDFTLKPEIGWMIRKAPQKKDRDQEIAAKIKQQDDHSFFSTVRLRTKDFPNALLKLDTINNIELDFTDSIKIPDEVKGISIHQLSLRGKVTPQDIFRISGLLPNTLLRVNGTDYTNPESSLALTNLLRNNSPNYNKNVLFVNRFPSYLLHLDTVTEKEYRFSSNLPPIHIHTDTIYNLQLDFIDSIRVPESAKKLNFDILYLNGKISSKEKERVIGIFPRTMLFINGSLCASDVFVQNYFHSHETNISAVRFTVTNFPEQLLHLDSIKKLVLLFTDSIHIPDAIKHIKTGEIYLYGKISDREKERIYRFLPNTVVGINRYLYAKSITKDYLIKELGKDVGKRYSTYLEVSDFPDALLQLDSIGDLTLNFEDSIRVPDAIKKVKIKTLRLQGKITEKETDHIAYLLPGTELYINGKSMK